MMSYEIHWDSKARDFLRTIERDIAKRIFDKVDSIRDNPKHFVERLVELNGYKLRVGDYRVILDIDESVLLIEVRLVGHRKNIYKELQR